MRLLWPMERRHQLLAGVPVVEDLEPGPYGTTLAWRDAVD
jgi:hypothetical protein